MRLVRPNIRTRRDAVLLIQLRTDARSIENLQNSLLDNCGQPRSTLSPRNVQRFTSALIRTCVSRKFRSHYENPALPTVTHDVPLYSITGALLLWSEVSYSPHTAERFTQGRLLGLGVMIRVRQVCESMRPALWISLCLAATGLSVSSQTVPTISACVNNLNGGTRVVASSANCIRTLPYCPAARAFSLWV
jgi:hypothetical protein